MTKRSELRKIDRIRIFISEFIEGIHSKIPLCCIISYCKHDGFEVAHQKSTEYGVVWEKFNELKIGYVPCKKCFEKRKFKKIKLDRYSSIASKIYPYKFIAKMNESGRIEIEYKK